MRSRSAALDGIRALAVVAVLAYHAHYPWAVGGYLGVDVFFVLSGYLITGVLLKTQRSWSGYRTFLVRRAVRLMPALLAAVAGIGALVLLVGTSRERSALLPCSGASLSYLMNLPWADGLSCPAMWHITWSLASEQQFYLVWPLVLCGLLVLRRRWALLGCLALGGAGLLWQIVLRLVGGSSTARLDYAPDGRSLVLLLGCALALAVPHLHRVSDARDASRGVRDAAAAVSVLALVGCFMTAALGPQMTALAPIVVAGAASAVLIVSVAHAPTSSYAARLLGARPMAYLGRISYSLYLWHEVAYRLAELLGPRGSLLAESCRWLFAVLLAAASYAWVELPAQRWHRNRQKTEKLVLAA